MECLENRNWKQIKAKLNAEASIIWMPQEFLKPLCWQNYTLNGVGTEDVLSEWLPKEESTHGCKWVSTPSVQGREEGGGKICEMGFERSRGHFLIVYKTTFTVFPGLR